jgi:hypothetical protein
MQSHRTSICIALLVTLFAGCSVYEDYPSFGILRNEAPSTTRIMTKDTVLYGLSGCVVLDSAIEGTGTRKVRGVSEDFTGQVPFRDIVYVQGREFSFFRTLIAGGALGAVGYYISQSQEFNGLHIWRPIGGGSSCPYVYAWNGTGFQIQGESFGTAFGKALETSTSCMLPVSSVRDGALLVRLANERPETHYVNSAHLFSCEAPAGAEVLLDANQKPWAVRNPLPPVQAPPEINKKDGLYWTSDHENTLPGRGFRDTIELTLPISGSPSGGSLIVHAINSHLVTAVYDIVFRYLGDQSLPFLYEVETNQGLIARLKEWIADCSLTVEVWKDGQWTRAGIIPPEADYVPFSKIVRVDAAGVQGKELRVRLTTLADVWHIDAIEIDWTASAPLSYTEQKLVDASHSVTGPVDATIQSDDRLYSIMFPGERIDMEFLARPSSQEANIVYFFRAGGYLYEGLPEQNTNEMPFVLASLDANRVRTTVNLVEHRDMLLALVYTRWREMRK